MAATRVDKLTPEAIVRVAIGLADREGLGALSMRRLGSELGYSGMSLYTHVANKDELLDLVADHVLGEVPDLDPAVPWPTAIAEFFGTLHAVLVRHRRLAAIFTLRPTRGPNTARHSRNVLAALAGAGLAPATAIEAYIALSCYTIGAALYSAARSGSGEPDANWITFGENDLPLDATARRQLADRAGSEQFRSGLEHLVRGYAAELS
jgi:AcrR family transcriptional regulator